MTRTAARDPVRVTVRSQHGTRSLCVECLVCGAVRVLTHPGRRQPSDADIQHSIDVFGVIHDTRCGGKAPTA